MAGPTSPGLLLPCVAYRPPQSKSLKPSKIANATRSRHITKQIAPTRLTRPPLQQDTISDTDSEIEDDFPTPRAHNAMDRIVSPPTSATAGQFAVSMTSTPSTHAMEDMTRSDDELYTLSSDDDSEIIPIKISNSVKRMVTQQQPPPLIMPPVRTMTNAGLFRRNASYRGSRHQTPLSPAALARLQSVPRRMSSKTSAPSLAESMTSEEPSFTDPETPDLRSDDDFGHGWEMPIQLSPKAMSTLHNLAIDAPPVSIDTIVQATESQVHEMKDRGLNISVITVPQQSLSADNFEPISAISIPSPGGFFASLSPAVQSVWSAGPDSNIPTTSMAKRFYNLPWGPRSSSITERVVEVDDDGTDGPPTARRLVLSPRHVEDVAEQRRQHEFDESYDHKLIQEASSKLNRTSLWLSQLQTYDTGVQNITEQFVQQLTASPELLGPRSPPPMAALPPPPARAVHPSQSHDSITTASKAISSSLVYNAFQHLYSPSSPKNDAFTHRQPRYDAVQTSRLYAQTTHIAQLSSQYPASMFASTSCDNDSFSHLPCQAAVTTDPDHQTLQNAGTQKKAIDAINLNVWNLQAHRLLSGDNLLPRSARTALRLAGKAGMTPMILDLGGQPTADWAWAIASEYRDGKVYTAVASGHGVARDDGESYYANAVRQNAGEQQHAHWKAHKGPSNHRVVQISAPWRLPFADETFDVVSARTLYQLCRLRNVSSSIGSTMRTTSTRSRTSATYIPGISNDSDFDTEDEAPPQRDTVTKDEWDATLAEIHRVLVPGGVLAFEILDAEIKSLDAPGMPGISSVTGEHTQATAALAARSADFVGLLERCGYDAAGSGTFVTRLVDGGFGRVERAWLSLPVDQGSIRSGSGDAEQRTDGGDVSMQSVTGLVGSLAWEKWMLKVQRESGRDEGRLLNGVGQALEGVRKDGRRDASKGAMGWTMLVGACRKGGGGKRSGS